MPGLLDKFLNETKIPENYDPHNDRETGYYSMAFKDKYIEWLEEAIKAERNENAMICEEKSISSIASDYEEGYTQASFDCAEAIRRK